MFFRQLFDVTSSTYTYLLADPQSKDAILIDAVREHVDRDKEILHELGFKLRMAFETHVHADHIAGSGLLREQLGCETAINEDAGAQCANNHLRDGQVLEFGRLRVECRKTPGHTDGCMTFVAWFADEQNPRAVFTGDTLLIRGCGRTDFQQGSSVKLFESVHSKIFSLPDATPVYPGHDYKGRTASTVGEEKQWNPRLGGGKTQNEFATIMSELKLAQPKQIAVAVPANLLCGMPQPVEKWAPIEMTADGVPEVSVAFVRENLGKFRLVDVREFEEYQNDGHIKGAELIPLGTVDKGTETWNREEAIVIHCRAGGRSARAAMTLLKNGFVKVASMRGGMLEWQATEKKATSCG